MTDHYTPHGTNLFGESNTNNHVSTLGEKFLLPPFSVLNARDGWWQERKRAWRALGIKSEVGREQLTSAMSHPSTTATMDFYVQKRRLESEKGRVVSVQEVRDFLSGIGRLRDDRALNKNGGLD